MLCQQIIHRDFLKKKGISLNENNIVNISTNSKRVSSV